MSAITDYIGIVYSGEGYVQGIMPQGASSGGDMLESGGDGEEPTALDNLEELFELLTDWGDLLGDWVAEACQILQQEQSGETPRAIIPLPPGLPSKLFAAIVRFVAGGGGPGIVPVSFVIYVVSKVLHAWFEHREALEFARFVSLFEKAFLQTNLFTRDSIPAKIATNIQSLTAQQKEMTDALETLDDKFEVTINGEAVSLTNLIQKKTTATDSGGTEYNILERILRALEALQYNNEIIDMGGVRVALRSKLITEP